MTTDLERYHRHHRIATGGMGEVWLAEDNVLHREVAVKYLKREYADNPDFHHRFLNEARTAASLHHPGIATVFDFGESEAEGGLPYLVMEYVPGKALSEILATETLSVERSRGLVLQAATALSEAHARGLVHRDVKPGNILVTDDGTAKITDFGIARTVDGAPLTSTGQVLGTPTYLSPEQAQGASATPASDVYALGVVLFECLAGTAPFVADSAVAVAIAHLREPVPQLPASVPADLAAVVATALAKDPAQRYPDAGAFAEALTATVGAPVATTLEAPLATGSTQVLDRGFIAAEIEGPARDRRLLVVGAALLGLLLVAAAIVGATSGGSDTKKQDAPAKKAAVKTVSVAAADFVGQPLATARASLTDLRLVPKVGPTVANPGGRTAGTVAMISPTGTVPVGGSVTIRVWGAGPPPPPAKHEKHHGDGKGDKQH
ncbi:MAG: serine/threonine protein kinase [Marmoricola sp.]